MRASRKQRIRLPRLSAEHDDSTAASRELQAAIETENVYAHAAAIGLALLPSAALAASAADNIGQAFALFTYVPQNCWLLLVFAPKSRLTRQVFEPLWPLCLVALLYLYTVLAGVGTAPPASATALELFKNIFDPAVSRGLDSYLDFLTNRLFGPLDDALLGNLFVSRWIWLEGRRRRMRTAPSVLLTNLIGPVGLLLHAATVQAYARDRPNDPDAKWSDPEALRPEQRWAAAAEEAAEEEAAVRARYQRERGVQQGFDLSAYLKDLADRFR